MIGLIWTRPELGNQNLRFVFIQYLLQIIPLLDIFHSELSNTRMPTYVILILCIAIAELLRRCCQVLIVAFTGPLSKVPGPLTMKLSILPWTVYSIRGTIMNIAPKLFDKYGDTVRVGKFTVSNLSIGRN